MTTLSVEEQSFTYLFLDLTVWKGCLSNDVVQLYSLRLELALILAPLVPTPHPTPRSRPYPVGDGAMSQAIVFKPFWLS